MATCFFYFLNYGGIINGFVIFKNIGKTREFKILFGREDEVIDKIVKKYKDVDISEKLALFGSNNMLQIAMNQGKANRLLGLKFHDIIRI